MDTRRGYQRDFEAGPGALPPHERIHASKSAHIGSGCTLGGEYLLHEELGHGGMGTVYRAEHLPLGRTVAVKVLDTELVDGPMVQRFRVEASTAGRLRHPNTVTVLDVGLENGRPFLVMEYVRGRSLRRLLTEDDVPTQRRGVDIIGQILGALDDAHRAGVVHADVKSDNVMVDAVSGRRDTVKLVDFGLARFIDPCVDGVEERGFAGTPEFMAPELIRGEPPSAASDLYAAGAMLYEVLTGTPPFVGGSSSHTLSMHLFDVVVPPSLRRPERTFSPALERVVSRALEKAPSARFASALEFATALAAATPPRADDPSVRLHSLDGIPHFVTHETTENFAPLPLQPYEEAVLLDRAAIREAIRTGAFEDAAARYLSTSDSLVEHGQLDDAIGELQDGVRTLSACAGSGVRAALLLWPLLATLARRLDDAGDRTRARRTAAHAARQAVRGGSTFGRDSTRLLLLHLALRRG